MNWREDLDVPRIEKLRVPHPLSRFSRKGWVMEIVSDRRIRHKSQKTHPFSQTTRKEGGAPTLSFLQLRGIPLATGAHQRI